MMLSERKTKITAELHVMGAVAWKILRAYHLIQEVSPSGKGEGISSDSSLLQTGCKSLRRGSGDRASRDI